MTPSETRQWFAKWAPAAQASEREFGVPASVTLAQAKFESADANGNAGRSKCALEANNYFGIKAVGNEDYCQFPTKEFKTGKPYVEPKAHFAKYASVEESFIAHGRLLSTLSRYRPAMESAHDPIAFAAQLQRCGYSTNEKYASLLTSEIRIYQLQQYDLPPEPPTPAKQENVA